ncbi:MAG: hypothetical protein RJA76_1161 [Bacteroidota bacterium]
MRKIYQLLFLSLLFFTMGCSSGTTGGGTTPTPTETVASLIKKSWSASVVSWDGVDQFQKTASSNIVSGYAGFKLDLSVSGTVKLTEFDGNLFTGNYTVSSDETTLKLTGLTSSSGVPSGTNGSLDFTIVSKPTAAGAMTIETTTSYIKASNKKVKLQLVSP